MNVAVILASGTGSRFRSGTPKQFLKLAGKMVLEHTIDAFERHSDIDEIVIVVSNEQRPFMQEVMSKNGYRKVNKLVSGGATRQESSASGVASVTDDKAKVLVHDAARPLLDAATITRCLSALDEFDAVDTGIESPDTIIQMDEDYCIFNIPDRSSLRLGQTPQAFRAGVLRQAHELAHNNNSLRVTDDCGIVLHYNLAQVHVVAGDTSNIKITYPSDVYLADRLFQLRSRQASNEVVEDDLNGKTLVVFGASRGIGQCISQRAETRGANVVAVSRSSGVNITDAEAVRETLQQAKQRYGKIDMVANTAGLLRTGMLVAQNYNTINDQIAINVTGSAVVAKEAYKAMQDTGGSIALFTSSSYTRGRAGSVVYSATKAAVVNLMQGLAEEYMPFNLRINAINPERTDTPMRTENFGKEPEDSLLDAESVAKATLDALQGQVSGQVIDVRR